MASKYGPFPYSPIVERPPLEWPNGGYVALWVIPNIEFFALDEMAPGSTDVPGWAVRDYGNRIGVFRLMNVLERYGVRATVALNSNVCDEHPTIIREGHKRDWEWMGHMQTNTVRLNAIPPDQEPGIIRETLRTIEAATGVRPRGWLSSGLHESWATPELLAREGCTYVADWVNDDQPYRMDLAEGRSLISVPYSLEINDKPAFERRNRTAAEFGEMIRRQFDVLYREGAESGRVMAIALHPYLTGVPHRIDAFEEALAYVVRHEHVWLATGAEIAAHYVSISSGAKSSSSPTSRFASP